MQAPDTIAQTIKQLILQIADEQSIAIDTVAEHQHIIEDLGFKSLDVATLVALLEIKLKVDPFTNNMASITEIRTVKDIVNVYRRCLSNGKGDVDPEEKLKAKSRGRMRRESIALKQ